MRRIYLLIFLVSVFLFAKIELNAQVTIGAGLEPEKAALLDLKTKDGGEGLETTDSGGLLLPRVTIDNINELTVFLNSSDADYEEQKRRHTGLAVYNITPNHENNIEKGVYIWNGSRWEKGAYRKRANFFYMPSIIIDTSTIGEKTPIDLYKLYKDQFESPAVASANAPDQIPFFVKPRDLFYYITDYDKNVLENISITEDGVMSYSVKAQSDESSYINIVLVVNVIK